MKRRTITTFLAGCVLAAGAVGVMAGSTSAHAAGLNIVETWHQELTSDAGAPIQNSSPTVATLDSGGPAVVVGDNTGKLWALHITNGSIVAGFPATTLGGGPINSPPSVSGTSLFAGVGNWAKPTGIGYQSWGPNGARRWTATVDSIWNNPSYGTEGVLAGLSVGNLQGQPDVFAGSLGQSGAALNAANGAMLPGFPWFQGDTIASTAALADLYSNGQTDMVDGGGQTAGYAFGVQYSNGGHVRVLGPSGQTICNYNLDEEVDSSPAVGEFLPGNAVGIVVGTGDYFKTVSTHDQLLAFNSRCGLVWARTLNGITDPSPALIDALGNHELQIATTTRNESVNAGTTYLLDGSGNVIWTQAAMGAPVGSPVSVDLGGGYQDLVVTGTLGMQILDGKTGQVIWSVKSQNQAVPMMQNSALVTDDPNGTVGITIAGYNTSPFDSEIVHYEVLGSNGSLVKEAGGWPEFHHDPQLTGDAGTPKPVVEVACKPPASPAGYWLAGSDGGMFTYGNLPFCGSTGSILLNRPIVGMSATNDGGGYWLVASDGGIFSFGDARFYGSTGAMHLNKPIVSMAATPDNRGYWLVASDGGIFSFGDARFYGSTGAMHLNKPIVSMAATPDNRGYWLVASDGGIFSFGDARFYGSTGAIHLNKPIVSMAATPDARGYWLVASDGGIFCFGDARYFGSTGALRLAQPIVGMAVGPKGGGYWLAAADGGLFSFGDAAYHGSAASLHPGAPVVAIKATRDAGGYWMATSAGRVYTFGDAHYYGSLSGVALSKPILGMAGL